MPKLDGKGHGKLVSKLCKESRLWNIRRFDDRFSTQKRRTIDGVPKLDGKDHGKLVSKFSKESELWNNRRFEDAETRDPRESVNQPIDCAEAKWKSSRW